MNIFIGMETSGMLRQRFQAQGHFVISVDNLPSEDGAGWGGWEERGGHIVSDAFETFWSLHNSMVHNSRLTFDLGIFHPDCTYLTNSAAWAFKDPDFVKHPGVGYHQKIKAGTLVGEARRAAREAALDGVRRIFDLPIKRKVIENPIGAITKVRSFTQIINPFQFGEDASKATGLILENLPPLKIDPSKYCKPRFVCQGCGQTWEYGKEPDECFVCSAQSRQEIGRSFSVLPRWSNQTDSGQNNLSPGEHRWKNRSRTYPGIADAMAEQWGKP